MNENDYSIAPSKKTSFLFFALKPTGLEFDITKSLT
jgi:hypothetical protein